MKHTFRSGRNFFAEFTVKLFEHIKCALALERGGDIERLLAVLAVADGSVMRHDNCLAVHVCGDSGGDALLELLCAGQTVCAEQNLVAYNLAAFFAERRDACMVALIMEANF